MVIWYEVYVFDMVDYRASPTATNIIMEDITKREGDRRRLSQNFGLCNGVNLGPVREVKTNRAWMGPDLTCLYQHRADTRKGQMWFARGGQKDWTGQDRATPPSLLRHVREEDVSSLKVAALFD